MRVLRLDSWEGAPGGAQEYVREISAELAARGHESRVIQLTDHFPSLPPPVGVHVRVDPGRLAHAGRDLVPDDALAERIAAEVASFQPDLVSLHHFDARFATIAGALSHLEVPLVFAAHDAELVCPISTLVRPGGVICEGGIRFRCLVTGCRVGLGGPYNLWQTRMFDRTLKPRVAAYLCPSRSLQQYLHTNGYRPALHLPSFARIPAELRDRPTPPPPTDAPPTVGYLGRLEWYKGVHDLIRGIDALARTRRDVRLEIAGDGPYRPPLERLVRDRGLTDRVAFRGHLTGAAKEAWFRGVHVAVTPSNMWENFPLVALEALVRARPVVATRIGGIPDIVEDGETGYLVGIDRPDEIADRLDRLLADPSRARDMGELGRRRVLERFTPERHVMRLLAVYDAVLGRRPLESGSVDLLLGRPAA